MLLLSKKRIWCGFESSSFLSFNELISWGIPLVWSELSIAHTFSALAVYWYFPVYCRRNDTEKTTWHFQFRVEFWQCCSLSSVWLKIQSVTSAGCGKCDAVTELGIYGYRAASNTRVSVSVFRLWRRKLKWPVAKRPINTETSLHLCVMSFHWKWKAIRWSLCTDLEFFSVGSSVSFFQSLGIITDHAERESERAAEWLFIYWCLAWGCGTACGKGG